MSGNLYSWFGYIQNNSTGQTSGVFGPLTADLDAAGFNIVNVALLSAGQISVGDLTIQNCATGPGGILKICDQLDVENLANVGSLNVETTSTLVGDVDIQSTMHMPNSEPLNTVNLFSVTNISGTGPPTSTPDKGALAFTDVDQILWVYDGTVWKDVITTTIPNLASVLLAGNTSGASNIVMSTNQSVVFTDLINILTNTLSPINVGFNNVATGPRSMTMGSNNSTLGDLSINLGNNNSSNAIGGMTFGHFCTALPPDPSRNAFAWGYGSTATGNESISQGIVSSASGLQSMAQGYQAIASADLSVAQGRDVRAEGQSSVVTGHLGRAKATRSSAYGYNAIVETGATDSTALGSNSIVNINHTNSLAVAGGSTTASNQFMVGGVNLVTNVPGSLLMNSSIATNSASNFLVLSKMAGIPTGAASSGALTFNTANNTFYGRTGAAWVPFVTGVVATPNLSQVLSTGNNTTGNNINVTVGDTIDFSGGMKLLGNKLNDVNNNIAAEIVNVAAGVNPAHPGFSAGPLAANISTVSSAADANLNIASKGVGSVELITATTARTHATGYMISDFQESAGLQNAVNQTIGAGAGTTRIITGTQIYNFSVANAFTMADVVNNRMNLRANSLYMVTANLSYSELANHSNDANLSFVLSYFNGVSANVIYTDSKPFPNVGSGSVSGFSSISTLVKTGAAGVQWVAVDLLANTANQAISISNLRFQIAKIN